MHRDTAKRVLTSITWALIAAVVAYLLLPVGRERESDGRVVIEYAYPGLPHEKEVYRALIKAFEKEHPGIHVKEVHPAAGLDILQKLQIQMAGGVPPDVCWLDVGSVYQFAKQGGLMPLDDFIAAEDYDLSDFRPQEFLDAARYNGRLHGLPRELNCCLTFYNKDYFKARGVPTPEELAAKGRWTWDEFIEVCTRLTDRSRNVFSHNVDFHHPWLLSPILEGYGTRLVALDRNECYLDTPENLAVLTMLRDFIYRYHIRPQAGEAEGKGDMFVSGQVAMAFVGRWMVPLYSTIEGFHWGVAPLPAGPYGSKTPLVGAFHCIPRNARHPKEAWELVKFLSGREGQAIAARMGLIIPARQSVAYSDDYLRYPSMDEKYNRLFIQEIYENGVLLPIDEHWNQVVETVYRGFESTFAGRESVAHAARRISPEVEEVLRESD